MAKKYLVVNHYRRLKKCYKLIDKLLHNITQEVTTNKRTKTPEEYWQGIGGKNGVLDTLFCITRFLKIMMPIISEVTDKIERQKPIRK